MKISFLIHTVYGIGGTIRTTLNLAEELANRHEVEIVSVFRHRDVPMFTIDPRIKVVPLVDTRPLSPSNEKEHPFLVQPSECVPKSEARYQEYGRLTDERVREHYAASDADVVIGTRPALVAYVAQFAPSSAVLIGQEHMTHHHHKPPLRAEMYDHFAALDALVTVSEGDAAVYREKMPLPVTRVLAIPNSVPEPPVVPADGSGRTVVAAGRLASEKQYEVLISAFAKVVAQRPDWDLRIYGWGPHKEALRRHIDKLRLYNSVFLMGPHSPIEPEWAKGAIAASTSKGESFGMTLVEAMRCGLPVISTDCDYGPREILKDGEDGLLVPVGDVGAVASALLKLIDDEPLRRRMSKAAVRNARRFDPGHVTKQYEELFGELRRAAALRAAAENFEPVADCVVAEDGGVTVALVAGQPAAAERSGLQLLCSRTDVRTDERRFAFDDHGIATIPADEDIAEGVWQCFVELPRSGRRVRITARAVDQRGAMRAGERVRAGAPVRNLVPYAVKPHGLLALRSWVRPVHAEAGDIQVVGKEVTVSGRLIGDTMSGSPVLLLRRTGGASAELTYPAVRQGEDGFRASFPCGEAAARQIAVSEVWDLWLRYAPGAEPVKIGRLLDDVVEKTAAYTYPVPVLRKTRPWGLVRIVARKLRGRPQQRVKARIHYRAGNDLGLHVADLPPK
ncbi:glycosyltransferase family 4 protein [Streptomyces sp. NPDC051219]|uniref:glycosyltransferase family 4 protein n=1 Tax=Streptomyces sp. NPDC051219 TaxID=3155283 RepID=UPI00342CB9E9